MTSFETPKSEDILKVINNFKSVAPRRWFLPSKGRLDMTEGDVNTHGHKCGSIHCHGGWYAIAANLHTKETVTYYDGALQMGKDLGFKTGEELRRWANQNYEIWGNSYGFLMFSAPHAFTSKKRPNGAEHLQHIIQHWEEVYERVKVIEEKNKPATSSVVYDNITKEIAKLPVDETPDKQKVKEVTHASIL